MERITLFVRTTKKDGPIKLRFRLRDGESVQLYHKSDIVAEQKDLDKFNLDGTIKGRVQIYNKDLKTKWDEVNQLMHQAYTNLCKRMDKSHISSDLFEKEIKLLKGGEKEVSIPIKEKMLNRFTRFIERGFKNGDFNEKRMKHYLFVRDSLERFLIIKGLSKISADEFTADMLSDLADYFADEYLYASKKKYAALFKNITNKRHMPTAKREHNTVVGRMKKLQAFFNELLDREEIDASPFQKLGRKRRPQVMTEHYENEPAGLKRSELLKVMETEVPETLKQTKDAFLVQCAFGYRIGDYQKITMDKIKITEDGIPYIHYLPAKTKRNNMRKEEIETPIMLFALELIKKWQFNFTIINYPGGENGYNKKIRQLLKHCGIDRGIREYNSETGENEYRPLHEIASNKICRATHVDLMRTVQIDLFLAGLHKRGSGAVHHYTEERIADHFGLMCAAFGQPLYKVDKDLNVIENENKI